MLVLNRKVGQSITIGKDIKVHFVEFRTDKADGIVKEIRLGIEAPRDVEIWRTELLSKDG